MLLPLFLNLQPGPLLHDLICRYHHQTDAALPPWCLVCTPPQPYRQGRHRLAEASPLEGPWSLAAAPLATETQAAGVEVAPSAAEASPLEGPGSVAAASLVTETRAAGVEVAPLMASAAEGDRAAQTQHAAELAAEASQPPVMAESAQMALQEGS